MKLVRRVALILAVALFCCVALSQSAKTADAYDPKSPNDVFEQMSKTQADLQKTREQSIKVNKTLASIDKEVTDIEFVKIPAAQAAVAVAQANYADAVEKSEKVNRRLEAAQNDKNRIEKQLETSTEIVETGKAAIPSLARDELRGEEVAAQIGTVLDAMSSKDFVELSEMNDALAKTETRLFSHAVYLKADAMTKTGRIKIVNALIETLKKEADETRAAAEKAKTESEEWNAKLQAMKASLETKKRENEKLKKDLEAQLVQLQSASAQLQAQWLAATGGGLNTAGSIGSFQFRKYSGEQGCTGGYPYCEGGKDYGIDPWKLYYRECVSYAAWRIARGYGLFVAPFNGHGNANQWPNYGPALSGAWTNNTPSPGAAAINPTLSSVGHAMVVEYVTADGWVGVSQYNFNGRGTFSTMEISASSAVYVHFHA